MMQKRQLCWSLCCLVVVSIIADGGYAALVNEACEKPTDCQVENSHCAPFADVCRPFGSFCQCDKGYKNEAGKCNKIAYFNETCGVGSPCHDGDSNMFCSLMTNRCTCSTGYVVDAIGKKVCIESPDIGIMDDPCSDDKKCGSHLQCVNGYCQCASGYRYDANIDNCTPLGLGDMCFFDEQCSNVLHSKCHKTYQFCSCAAGYLGYDITKDGKKAKACLPPKIYPRLVGQNCSETDETSYCQYPFICKKCDPAADGVSVCSTVIQVDSRVNASSSIRRQPEDEPSVEVDRIVREDDNEATTQFATWLPTSENPSTAEELTTTEELLATEGPTTTEELPATEGPPEVLLNSQCSRTSQCRILFSVCQNGQCKCADGYLPHGTAICREQFDLIALGGKCDTSADCATDKADCSSNGTCECGEGYKRGFHSDCIESSRVSGYNQRCSSTSECYYNFVCTLSRCKCSFGYKKSSKYGCKKRYLQDECPSGSDVECRFVGNASCQRINVRNREKAFCKCIPGYTRKSKSECVPMRIENTMNDFQRSWQGVPCQHDTDCHTSAAPAYSVCLKPSNRCGCSPGVDYVKEQHRCAVQPGASKPECESCSGTCVEGECKAAILSAAVSKHTTVSSVFVLINSLLLITGML